jgi:hypothetical protein
LSLWIAFLASFVPAVARAQDELETKRACATSYEQTQRLRQDGKLVEAREQAVLCAQSTCPALLTADCARWVDELDQALPSVIVDAHDEAGRELPGLRVVLDGRELAKPRAGVAFALNPGPHRFRFQAPGRTPVELEEVVVQGRKNRPIEVVLKSPAISLPAAPRPSVGPWLYVSSAAGALGIVGFTYFGLIGQARESDAKSGCAPRCSDAELKPMKQAYLAADISLGLAVTGAVTSLVLLAAGYASPERAADAHQAHVGDRYLRNSTPE